MASGLAALAIGALFLAGLAVKERDNRFCIACHLHEAKFERLTAAVPDDLAGHHHRRDAAVGCIACHGGADVTMRLRVWTVAGIDTLRFLSGAYQEPTTMRLPLRDAECRQCHTPILPADPAASGAAPLGAGVPSLSKDDLAAEMYGTRPEEEGRSRTEFHAIRDHDTVDVRCVRCHTVHTTGSDARNHFLSPSTVGPVCRECHVGM